MTGRAVLILCVTVAACGGGRPAPATLDARNDLCASCRMAVSDPTFAAQIAAPGEEPLFFDDIGCLATYLRQRPAISREAVAYVTDHRTGEWVAASAALFTRVDALSTPMGSHLLAHASAASRDQDGSARGGTDVRPAVLSPVPFPDGAR
jgi:copper chaperone NosL